MVFSLKHMIQSLSKYLNKTLCYYFQIREYYDYHCKLKHIV